MKRTNISTNTPWESTVGYSRAVRIGNHVWVAGTTASDETGNVVHPHDAAAQTRFILAKIESALKSAGASMHDVVRTRLFVTDISQWEAIGRVHGEVFGEQAGNIRPVSSMVEVSALIDPLHLVEIEVDAFVIS